MGGWFRTWLSLCCFSFSSLLGGSGNRLGLLFFTDSFKGAGIWVLLSRGGVAFSVDNGVLPLYNLGELQAQVHLIGVGKTIIGGNL